MGSGKPSSKELIVKAQTFISIEPTNENLRSLQTKLTRILNREGYHTKDRPLPFTTPERTMEFFHPPPPSEKTWWEKWKNKLTPGNNQPQNPFQRDDFIEGLKRLREDLPFRIVFRFKTFRGDDIEGYDVFIESTPVLLQKDRQIGLGENYHYSVENIVDQNKREITRILGYLELEPTRGPYTEAEQLDTQLPEETVEQLEQHQYGRTALQYANEGDQSLKQGYLHAALSCYIQSIEWTILHHKIIEEDEDLVQKQQEGEINPVYFTDLIDELEGTNASQKTISKLNSFNIAERRWIAHHKSGQLERQEVENVRSTLIRLTNELL